MREAIFLANDGEEKSALINRVSSTIYIALLLLPFFFFFFSGLFLSAFCYGPRLKILWITNQSLMVTC